VVGIVVVDVDVTVEIIGAAVVPMLSVETIAE